MGWKLASALTVGYAFAHVCSVRTLFGRRAKVRTGQACDDPPKHSSSEMIKIGT